MNVGVNVTSRLVELLSPGNQRKRRLCLPCESFARSKQPKRQKALTHMQDVVQFGQHTGVRHHLNIKGIRYER